MIAPYYDEGGIQIWHGRCEDILPGIAAASVQCCVTSPPYAEQRKGFYNGIPEAEYPAWTVAWMEALRPALTPDASVLINIREHVADGEISDYVLRTRLALRAAGWIECDELIWVKPDAPPVGHPYHPRRSWERVLWFSRNRQPYCNPQANGRASRQVGMTGGHPEWVQTVAKGKDGIARCQDVVVVPVSGSRDRVDFSHPAPYPVPLAAWLINLVSRPGDVVLDPFVGSGSTLRAAVDLNRRAIGIEREQEFAEIAARRLSQNVFDFEVPV